MLDEFCEHYGYERKHAIKLLGDQLPKPNGGARAGAEPVYEPVREVIETIWKASEHLWFLCDNLRALCVEEGVHSAAASA